MLTTPKDESSESTEAKSVEEEEIKTIVSPEQAVMDAPQESVHDHHNFKETARAGCEEMINQGDKADPVKVAQSHIEMKQAFRKHKAPKENVDSSTQSPEEAVPPTSPSRGNSHSDGSQGQDAPNDSPSYAQEAETRATKTHGQLETQTLQPHQSPKA